VARYEDLLDEMDEKNQLLTLKLKRAEEQIKHWRSISNSLAHALALSTGDKTQPLWVYEYYRTWENKSKEWWGVKG
jgi:hypothetical protein